MPADFESSVETSQLPVFGAIPQASTQVFIAFVTSALYLQLHKPASELFASRLRLSRTSQYQGFSKPYLQLSTYYKPVCHRQHMKSLLWQTLMLRCCGRAGVADMPVTALELDRNAGQSLTWSLKIHKGDVLLMLSSGGKQCVTAGVVQAVADSMTAEVKLQCPLDVKLLYPAPSQRSGAYSLFRATDLNAQPVDTVQVAAMSATCKECVCALISLAAFLFRRGHLPFSFPASLETEVMNADSMAATVFSKDVTKYVATALAYVKTGSGDYMLLHALQVAKASPQLRCLTNLQYPVTSNHR